MHEPYKVTPLRNIHLVSLALILVLAIVLRFYGIAQRDLVFHDEAAFLIEAQSVNIGLAMVKDNLDQLLRGSLTFSGEGYELLGRIKIFTAHPGHTFLLWLASLLIGMRDYTGIALSALFGSLTVGLVFLVGRRYFSTATGLVAAAFLAVSEYHLAFSRTGLTEAPLTFFFLLGLYLYFLSWTAPKRTWLFLFLTGLCIGFVFTIHYRAGIAAITLIASEVALNLFPSRRLSYAFLKRLGVLGLGTLLPALTFELPYRLLLLLTTKVPQSLFTYSEQLTFRLNHFQGYFTLADWYAYIRYFWWTEHPWILALLAAGIALLAFRLIKTPSLAVFLTLFGFLLPFLFFSFYTNSSIRFPRSIVMILPLAALISGEAVVSLRRLVKGSHSLVLPLLVLPILGVSLFYDVGFVRRTSDNEALMSQMALHLKQVNQSICVDPFHEPIWIFYTQTLPSLAQGPPIPIRCSDGNLGESILLSPMTVPLYEPGFLTTLMNEGRVLFKAPHELGRYRLYLLESGIDSAQIEHIVNDPFWSHVYALDLKPRS